MYTTSAVISEDQKEVIFKKFMNPLLKKVNVKVPLSTDNPLPIIMSYERECYAYTVKNRSVLSTLC